MSVCSFVEGVLTNTGNSVFTYTIHRLKGGYFCGVGGDKGANPFDSVAENRFYFHMHYAGDTGSIPAKTWWEARFDSVGSLVADVSLK